MDRNEFKELAKSKIDNLFKHIDELEAKKESVSAEMSKTYDEKINKLKESKTHLQQQYQQLSETADDKWEDVKTAFSKSSASFKNGLDELTKIFN